MKIFSVTKFFKKKSSYLFKDMLVLVLIGLVFACLSIVMNYENREYINRVIQWFQLQSSGSAWSDQIERAFLFISISAILITLGIPRLWVSAIAGVFFGAVLGAVWALLASLIGAVSIYWIGRKILGNLVRRRLTGKFSSWKMKFQENAFWWVLYGRLFPLSNATLFSILSGSCHVPFIPYLVASFFGFIPLTVVFAVFGDGGFHGRYFQIFLGFFLLGGIIIIRKLMMRTKINKIALVLDKNDRGSS